ncbi:MAG: hypothetical protein JXA57_11225 [Armatimonadetes bacterium]|nr:hypothetical protein [Armatimonadota bacterium]
MGRHHSKAEIKEVLAACHGQVYLAAERLGCWPSALYARIRKDPELQSIIDLYDGRRVDAAELKLEQAIKNGESWAVLFTLRTKGRDRGYSEKVEVEQSGRLSIDLEPPIGPQLEGAISRILDIMEPGGKAGAPSAGDTLPPGFKTPR